MKIYVGNLPFTASQSEVQDLFEKHGTVQSVALIEDRETGRPRGFGFVEMAEESAGRAAIDALNGTMLNDRGLNVSEARPRERADSNRW